MKRKVLVIAVHPDDETLGAGGTLLRHKTQGDEINWVICASVLERYGFDKTQVGAKTKIINLVAKKYHFNKVFKLDLEPMKIDQYPIKDLIHQFEKIISRVKPTDLYLPYCNDPHSDHRVIFNAVWSCVKTFRQPSIRKVCMMEVQSETDFSSNIGTNFSPNYFVDITEFLEKKIEIMELYRSEIGKHPFPRSSEGIKALATVRGIQTGVRYAEGLMILKEIY